MNRFAAWLAIVAITLQGLWPLIAQAKPHSVELVPVCTVAGVTHYIEVETGGPAPSHEEHCKACPIGAVALASGVLASFTASTFSAPQCEVASGAGPRFVSHARPRAPPQAP